jgi:SOS response regulatory protein OraA/RecX
MNIDHELRDALRRTQAPDDLADRVLARINEGDSVSHTRSVSNGLGSRTALRWLAAAAVVTLTVGGAERYYTRQQQAAETARAQQELRLALQITNDTMARVQSKLSTPADNGR